MVAKPPTAAQPGLLQGPLPPRGPWLLPPASSESTVRLHCGGALTHPLSCLLSEEQN